MALQRAIKTGGSFLDLKELAADGPVLCVFRVKEFQDAERGDFGWKLPVIADVLICSGPSTGQVHPGERFIGAITSPLRGVTNPKQGEPVPPAVNPIGAEIVVRVDAKNKGKNNAFAVGDEPSDAEFAAVEQVYQGGAAWNAAPAAQVPAQAGASGNRPW